MLTKKEQEKLCELRLDFVTKLQRLDPNDPLYMFWKLSLNSIRNQISELEAKEYAGN